MKILGICLGANSTASILVDGEIVACVSEERFSRKKNDEGYPKQAIEYCLREAGLKIGADLDAVVYSSTEQDLWHLLTRYYSSFKIPDLVDEMREYWRPVLYEGKEISWSKKYRDRCDLSMYPGNWNELVDKLSDNYYKNEEDRALLNKFFVDTVANHIGVPRDRVSFVDHHTGHAAYAFYASPFRDQKTLVLTIDAYGDANSASISVAEGGHLKRIKTISHKDFVLARYYRYTTLILGMKPNEHEYKLMGLAPYAKPHTYKKAYEIYKNTMYVDGLDFKFHERPQDSYYYFKDKFEGLRFDGIAGGLQKYTEEIVTERNANAIKHTGVSRVAIAGGVSMNVKAMMEVAAMPEVTDIFVPPSGGDESLCMGVCYHVCKERFDVTPTGLKNAYLGPAVDATSVKKIVLDLKAAKKDYAITEGVTARKIAEQLSKGRVIGRCSGRMEFGARSLGNRSILADPRSPKMVPIINEKIKNRDFWMPFAPAMLREKHHEYVKNPKNLRAPYMTLAFPSTDSGWEKMQAAIHPADHTARPQFVDSASNPGFAEILTEFDKLTGVAVLLNTSFNLHGEPIVNTAADALRVFELTDIDDLVIGDVLVSKNRNDRTA